MLHTGITPRALPTREAGAYIGVAKSTLEDWRTRGIGPRFVRLGTKSIRYRVADLDAFLASCVCPTNDGPQMAA